MRAKFKHIYFSGSLAVLLLIPVLTLGQHSRVQVRDAQTGEPCPYANVVLTGMDAKYIHAGATDKNGEFSFTLEERARICITFVGYRSYIDTIQPGQGLIVDLEPDLINLDAVVVTGQHSPKAVDQSIYKIDVVDSRIMQQRGVNNLAEALANETSIRLRLDPATGTSVQLQGMSGENIKYLIDGIPISGRVRGNIDLEQINMENIDHIEIVKGPMAVQYGTGAIAGVINIITKQNSYFRNLLKVNSYVDSKNKYTFGFYASLIRRKHSFTWSGNRSLFQGIDIDLNVDEQYPDGHDRYMEFKPKQVYNTEAEYAFRNQDFQLRLKSQYMNSLIKDYANYAVGLGVYAYDSDYYTNRSTSSLSIGDQINDKLSYQILGAYTWYGRNTHHITSDLHELTHVTTDTSVTTFHTLMSRGSLSYEPGNKLTVLTGWDMNYDLGSGDKIDEDAKIGDFAWFLSGQYAPWSKLSIQPGLRLIYNTKYGAPLIPSLSFHWNMLDKLIFRASYGRGFRSPSLKELYMDFRDSNHNISGNPDLKAETTNSFNTSLDFKHSGRGYSLKIEPSAFYNKGKDVIILSVTDAQSNSATYENLGRQRTMGGEINASFQHASGFMARAGFSRIGESYDSEGLDEWTPLYFYNNYNLSLKYALRNTGSIFHINLKYYGETPRLASLPEQLGGGIYQVYAQPYGDLEATISQKIWKDRLTLVLGGKNLLNYYEGVTTGYQTEQETLYNPLYYGRVWFVKLNLRFRK